jgi:hypothetical protein
MAGPYKRRNKLTVADNQYQVGDIVQERRRRWIIRNLTKTTVTLEASAAAIWWHTTPTHLPPKRARR